MQEEQYYNEFQTCFDQVKNNLVMFLLEAKKKGKKVAAYGAAAKGNTLLNYAGVKPDLIPFVCDAAASKQGKFLPGSHIPVLAPQELEKYNPDFVMILPWNIAPEVRSQNKQLEEKGTKFFKAIPELLVL
jgi:hypothetical protein